MSQLIKKAKLENDVFYAKTQLEVLLKIHSSDLDNFTISKLTEIKQILEKSLQLNGGNE